jgi:hypothetical protein
MGKVEKGQPHDTTGAHAGKDSYNSDSVNAKGNYHQAPKSRQDGKGSGRGSDNKAANWTYKHSLPGEKKA